VQPHSSKPTSPPIPALRTEVGVDRIPDLLGEIERLRAASAVAHDAKAAGAPSRDHHRGG